MLPGRASILPRRLLAAPDPDGDPFERYLSLCSDYFRRQMLIYHHWPQRRWDATGYRDEKVFTERNA